ncbi:unnamed protein product, partial [Staurois parvus]
MALGRKGLTWGNQRVNSVLCAIVHYGMCLCFTVSTLLCMVVLCTAMQSSVQELTGRRTVLFTNSSHS